jgi:hypothetical protein
MTTDKHNAPSVAHSPCNSRDNATAVARYDLSTSEGGRRYIAEFFATELGRHDFTDYIGTRLAADFACALAQHLAATGKQQVGEVQGDARAALEASMPYLETLHSIVGGEARTSVWRCIERGRLALAARQPGAQVPVATVHVTHGGFGMELATHVAYALPVGTHSLYGAPPTQGIDLGQQRPLIARALAEWHEDDGNVMWWAWCGRGWAGEAAWCGTPTDSDWPGYHTHWTQHPDQPALIDQRDAAPGVGNG